jgi:DNA-binding NarL/FixJ family response regulator
MSTSPAPERLRVLVASDQALIADAVRAALASRGHDARVVRWPGDGAHGLRRRPTGRVPMVEVGLLLSDLDRWSRIRAAALVVERIRVPWVVLTTSPRGPAWGGVLSAGAQVVVPGTTRLDGIGDLLLAAVRRQLAMPAAERLELEQAWQAMRARHDGVVERVSRLTPREREVLRLMYAGASVARIAELFEVAPATVRSQVKAVLRKLDVNSQLAAVAAFDDVLDLLDRRQATVPPVPPAPRSGSGSGSGSAASPTLERPSTG